MLKSAVIEEKKFKHSPLGSKLWCQQEGLITMVITKFKKNLFNLWLYTHLFYDLKNVYSPMSGADHTRGQNFYVNRNLLSLRSFVASLKKISLKSDFIQFFFQDFIHVYSPGSGADSPQGTKVWCQQKCLHSFVASFKKIFLKSDFIQFFHDLIRVYIPWAGADSPQGTTFWCQQKGLITLPICCKFQRNLFEVWFYTIFFHDLIHVYSPGAESIQPPGDKVLMSTETSCHFGHLLLVTIHRQV